MAALTEQQIKSKIRLCDFLGELAVCHELPGDNFRLEVPNMPIGHAIVHALRERARMRSAMTATWLVRVNYRTKELKACTVTVPADTAQDAVATASDMVRKRRGVIRVGRGENLGGRRAPEEMAAKAIQKLNRMRNALAEAERLIHGRNVGSKLDDGALMTATLAKLRSAIAELRVNSSSIRQLGQNTRIVGPE